MTFRVEFRSEEGWGHFSVIRFDDELKAVGFADRAIRHRVNNPLIAARVWEVRGADIGDRVTWDSRD